MTKGRVSDHREQEQVSHLNNRGKIYVYILMNMSVDYYVRVESEGSR